ncbi:hypothetical protein V6N13_097492 [Hibiscus sabdariffa]
MHDSAVDIWALRCSIVEMFTKKPSWNFKPGTNRVPLLIKIEVSHEFLGIPQELYKEGKDFLGKCFVKDSKRHPCSLLNTSILQNPATIEIEDEGFLGVYE